MFKIYDYDKKNNLHANKSNFKENDLKIFFG
jgi:hypothetical protein